MVDNSGLSVSKYNASACLLIITVGGGECHKAMQSPQIPLKGPWGFGSRTSAGDACPDGWCVF